MSSSRDPREDMWPYSSPQVEAYTVIWVAVRPQKHFRQRTLESISKTMISELLEQDHGQLSELLNELEQHLGQHDHDRSFALLDLFWARLAMHIRAENLWLFPAILNAPRESSYDRNDVPSFEEAATIVESLRSDHNFFMDELSKAVKTFRVILATDQKTGDLSEQLETIRERVKAVSLRLQSHNDLEEDRVYKWASLFLSAGDLENLSAALRQELENLPPRFAASHQHIIQNRER